MSRSLFGVILAGCLISAPIQSAEGGVIPWTFDALFGPPGSLQQWALGYPNGNPYLMNGYGMGGYGGMGYRAGYAPYAANYGGCGCGPTTSFYAPAFGYNYGASYAPMSYGYGYGNCGCSPCGGCGTCSNCANGDCGVNSSYSPSPEAQPNVADPDSGTRTFQKKNLDDDFVPTNKGLGTSGSDEEVVPNLGGGDFMKPAPGEPGGNLNNGGGLQPLNNGGANDGGGVFPNNGGGVFPNGGGDANEFDALKPTTDVEPLNLDIPVATNVKPNRSRILMRTGYRIPSVARVRVSPTPVDQLSNTKIAAK